MKLAKLDTYDYEVFNRLYDNDTKVIRININGTTDPDIVDIMSEIQATDGRIYIDGHHYSYLDNYRLFPNYMELDVIEVA